MGKSYKQPIVKDKTDKKLLRRKVRSSIKNIIKSKSIEELSEEFLPNHNEIVNDYDYCDYKFFMEDDKYKRK